ncbi:Metalloenzyme, LuxS/M16 peptidase-like protein [Syncephalis plumigaleata]|nr:Metalloenzyme, LuxS/M16 peptidase-like protein [Syncephalis plumigaleata]
MYKRLLSTRSLTNIRTRLATTFQLSTVRHLNTQTSSHRLNNGNADLFNSLTRITTLNNGLRVATEGTPGHFASIGVFIDAGSRYESPLTQGCSHLLDRMAFKSTQKRDAEQMMTEMEELGGNLTCSSSRECLMYQSAVFKQDVPRAVDLLADVVRSPRLTEEELQEQMTTVPYEIEEVWSKPELILPELLHQAAYQGNTLGNPLLCPAERLDTIQLSTLNEFRHRWFHPGRTVLAGAGVDHDALVALAEQYFGTWQRANDSTTGPDTQLMSPPTSLKTSIIHDGNGTVSMSSSSSSTIGSNATKLAGSNGGNGGHTSILRTLSSAAASMLGKPIAQATPIVVEDPYTLATLPAHYTGGTLVLEAPEQEFTHLYVGFKAAGLTDPDMYTLATMQLLLGGGGSFSAGGPGKGMYSRLYTRVLNRHHWVESCAAFLHGYSDAGLFGISASCRPDWAHALADVIAREFSLLAEPDTIHQSELDRAKNQLKSSVLMNLESRMVQLEDLGRQVQIYGKRISADEMRQRVDAVTLDDVRQVASKMLHSSSTAAAEEQHPTIVAYGPTHKLKNVPKVLRKYGIGA